MFNFSNVWETYFEIRRHPNYWQWYQFAVEAQDVLIYGSIPTVYASIPLSTLLSCLPTYFLKRMTPDIPKPPTPLAALAWDPSSKHSDFMSFCSTAASTTASQTVLDIGGAVRLALAFLRPWLQECKAGDAVETLAALASHILMWPRLDGRHVGEQEIRQVAELVMQNTAEEIESTRTRAAQITRLQEMVNNLQRQVKEHEPAERRWEEERKFFAGVLTIREEDQARKLLEVTANLERLARDQDARATAFFQHAGQLALMLRGSSRMVQGSHLESRMIAGSGYITEEDSEERLPLSIRHTRPPSMIETASGIVTGLLFGALITLYVINSQRRAYYLGGLT